MTRPPPTNARSIRTRRALLAAARSLVEEGGTAAMTMAAVADRSEVSRRAVYLHFSSRGDLINALLPYVNEVEDLAGSLAPIRSATDTATMISAYAEFIANFVPRILAVSNAIYRASDTDAAAAEHWASAMRGRRQTCNTVISQLESEGRLAPEWSHETAVDLLLSLIANDGIATLLHDCQWSSDELAERLETLFRRTFVA